MRQFLKSAFLSGASFLIPLILLGAIAIAVQPWGNYPVDDDWQYARAAQQFAATGRMVIDTPIAPSLVGQLVIAYPVIRAFGFSHTRLRILTLVLSALMVVLLDGLLRYARVETVARTLALSLFVINPLYQHLAFSFMTEIYGYTVSLLAALIWFRGRSQADRAAEQSPETPLISWPAAMVVGFLSAACFWIRQYCVLVLPACIAAAVISAALCGHWHRIRNSILRLTASLAVGLGGVASYLEWSQLSGNLKTQFSVPLLHGSPALWPSHVGIFMTYMTAFFLPLLLLLLAGHKRDRRIAIGSFILVMLGLGTAFVLSRTATPGTFFAVGLHTLFPFLSGVLYNTSVGPPTLNDVFVLQLPNYPQWPESAWMAVEAVLLLANGLWVGVYKGTQDFISRKTSRGLPAECLAFGFLFAGSSFAASVIGSGTQMFDRYYFPCVIGLTLAMAILLADRPQPSWHRQPSRRVRAAHAASLVAFAALAFFTVAGVHDYFRLNDARWSEVTSLLSAGVSPANIDGGYEVNGWLLYGRASMVTRGSSQCIGGSCRCVGSWYCFDDSYRIGMNVFGEYKIVGVQQPNFWLTKAYPVIVSRRAP